MSSTEYRTIKSKIRIRDHGEVFTQEREVNDMLNLVRRETERVDSRFFEPACGNGNFLAEILERKLGVVSKRYKKSQLEFEKNAMIALASMYGVDILEDNVIECRERLLEIFKIAHSLHFSKKLKSDLVRTASFILTRNILRGDALTLKTTDGQEPSCSI